MRVVLLKDIESLGREGDLVKVKDGYGRNYLIPQKLALAATKANIKKSEELKKSRLKQQEKNKQHFLQTKEKIENLSLTITAEAKEDEVLYGNITDLQICNLLQREGVGVAKEKIILEQPIDKLGVYKILIRITSEIEATLRLWVVKK